MIGASNSKMTVVKGPRTVLHQNENDCMAAKTFKRPNALPNPTNKTTRTGRWTQEEKLLFLYGLNKFGRGKWKKIGTLLPTRSLIQIKSHAQKVMKRYQAGENIFAPLGENREYFDYMVLPKALQRSNSNNLKVAPASMPGLVDEYTKVKSPNIRKQVLAASSSMNKRPKTSSRNSPTLARRSVFQATLGNGNGNLSFSFKPTTTTTRKPCHRVTFKEQPKSPPPPSPPAQHCHSPRKSLPVAASAALHDSAASSRGGGAAIAAAALCQLSTLGRSGTSGDQAVIVSP